MTVSICALQERWTFKGAEAFEKHWGNISFREEAESQVSLTWGCG